MIYLTITSDIGHNMLRNKACVSATCLCLCLYLYDLTLTLQTCIAISSVNASLLPFPIYAKHLIHSKTIVYFLPILYVMVGIL